jgi:hypothetical protein
MDLRLYRFPAILGISCSRVLVVGGRFLMYRVSVLSPFGGRLQVRYIAFAYHVALRFGVAVPMLGDLLVSPTPSRPDDCLVVFVP